MQNAIVSSFPISEQPSEQDQRVMRRQAEILVVEASDPVAEMAHRTRMYVLRDLIAQDYNTAVTLLTADFRTVQEKNPAEAYACRIVIDSWLIANGMRAIKWDEKVSSTIQAGREVRKKGLLRRWVEERFLTDGQKQTALIHEALDLAGKNEALRLENHRLATANQEIEARSQRMFIEASGKGEAVIARAQSEAREILSYARSEAEKRERTAERRLEKLQQDIAKLEQAKQKVLTDQPELALALQTSTKDSVADIQDQFDMIVSRLKFLNGASYLESFRERLQCSLEIMERTAELIFSEMLPEDRPRILSIPFRVPEFSLELRFQNPHPPRCVLTHQDIQKILGALANPDMTREQVVAPLKELVQAFMPPYPIPGEKVDDIVRKFDKKIDSLILLSLA